MKRKVREVRNSLEALMNEQRPYTNNHLTIEDVATQISVHTHELSRVINQEFNMNFTDYINSFRLKEVARKLANAKNSHLKISQRFHTRAALIRCQHSTRFSKEGIQDNTVSVKKQAFKLIHAFIIPRKRYSIIVFKSVIYQIINLA